MLTLKPEVTGSITEKDIRRLMEIVDMQTRWNEEDLKRLSDRADAINERMDRLEKERKGAERCKATIV